jgi:hypothetical protein
VAFDCRYPRQKCQLSFRCRFLRASRWGGTVPSAGPQIRCFTFMPISAAHIPRAPQLVSAGLRAGGTPALHWKCVRKPSSPTLHPIARMVLSARTGHPTGVYSRMLPGKVPIRVGGGRLHAPNCFLGRSPGTRRKPPTASRHFACSVAEPCARSTAGPTATPNAERFRLVRPVSIWAIRSR